MTTPQVIAVAGPNGAGKSTTAPCLLVVRRRYDAGLKNLFKVYIPLVDSWKVLDNSESSGPRLIAAGRGSAHLVLSDVSSWAILKELAGGR